MRRQWPMVTAFTKGRAALAERLGREPTVSEIRYLCHEMFDGTEPRGRDDRCGHRRVRPGGDHEYVAGGRVSPHNTAVVLRFGRGVQEALQSVQVSETPSQVVITVNLAIRREFTEGIYAVTPVLIIERTIVELSEPLGERAIVDGAT